MEFLAATKIIRAVPMTKTLILMDSQSCFTLSIKLFFTINFKSGEVISDASSITTQLTSKEKQSELVQSQNTPVFTIFKSYDKTNLFNHAFHT